MRPDASASDRVLALSTVKSGAIEFSSKFCPRSGLRRTERQCLAFIQLGSMHRWRRANKCTPSCT
jgi:hypothetical protein